MVRIYARPHLDKNSEIEYLGNRTAIVDSRL